MATPTCLAAPGDSPLSLAGRMLVSMTAKWGMPPSRDAFLAEVDPRIAVAGYRSGEALVPRDAAGRKRLGQAGGRMVVAIKAVEYGVEPEFEGPPRYGGENIIIRRSGHGAGKDDPGAPPPDPRSRPRRPGERDLGATLPWPSIRSGRGGERRPIITAPANPALRVATRN